MRIWYVYILENTESRKFYIGCTSNVHVRVKEHNFKRKKSWSGRQTGSWQLMYTKSFESKSCALKFERNIKKKKSHLYIERLIATEHNSSGSSISLA